MPNEALLAVLLGALLHAGWNAAIKSGAGQVSRHGPGGDGAGAIAAALLPFLPMPAPRACRISASRRCCRSSISSLVAAAYRAADMSYAYPLMRGTAPLLVASVSGVVLGEDLNARAWVGVALICGSVLALTLLNRRAACNLPADRLRPRQRDASSPPTPSSTGSGRGCPGSVASYTLWLSLLTAPPLLGWARGGRARAPAGYFRSRWWVGLAAAPRRSAPTASRSGR